VRVRKGRRTLAHARAQAGAFERMRRDDSLAAGIAVYNGLMHAHAGRLDAALTIFTQLARRHAYPKQQQHQQQQQQQRNDSKPVKYNNHNSNHNSNNNSNNNNNNNNNNNG
jgi:hypothetical protein